MFEMRAEVLREFLDLPVPAILSTLRRDGSPYTIPLWYLWEGEVPDDFHPSNSPPAGHVWFLGAPTSTWVRHLHRDPRMSLCIDVEEPMAKHVGIDGSAEILSEDDTNLWAIMRRLVERYVGRGNPANEEAIEQYMETTRSMTPILFRVTPTKWRAIDLSEFEAGQEL
jgi:PPOX class probable F420-dependent enzyme